MLVAWALYDDKNGRPLTGATPSFTDYLDRGGVQHTPPAITPKGGPGGNQYGFEPTADDCRTGIVYRVDNGSGATPRFTYGCVSTPDAPFLAWGLEDENGFPWAGAPPVIAPGNYADATGPRTPPVVHAHGMSLYSVTPSSLDATLGVTLRVDSPPGAFPEFIQATLQGVYAAAQTQQAPTTAAPVSVAEFPSSPVDFGTEVSIFPELDATFTPMTTARVVGEALYKRFTTPKGALPFHPEYGEDVRAWLNEGLTSGDLHRLKSALESQAEQEERIRSVSVALDLDVQAQRLTLGIVATTASGPFRYVMTVSQLDTSFIVAAA